jgi:hypothetical protein
MDRRFFWPPPDLYCNGDDYFAVQQHDIFRHGFGLITIESLALLRFLDCVGLLLSPWLADPAVHSACDYHIISFYFEDFPRNTSHLSIILRRIK